MRMKASGHVIRMVLQEISMPELTALLAQARQGDKDAGAQVFSLLYDDLKRLARVVPSMFRRGRPAARLNPVQRGTFLGQP